MTQEELLSVAAIVERLVKRFEEQGADHERQRVEWNTSFAARTGAGAKIIEGLRAQVQDQLAEIERLGKKLDGLHLQMDMRRSVAKGKEAWSDVPNATQWVEDMRGNTEATHDTPAGKEAAEASVMGKIEAGNVVEVVSDKSWATFSKDIGRRGKVIAVADTALYLKAVPGYAVPAGGVVGKCDVRKVTT